MSNQVMELNRAQMEQMVRQANSALQMYDKIIEVEQRVNKAESRMNQTAEKTERRLHKIETTYPLLDTEADRLQSIATIKAHQFTGQFFGEEVSQELYMKKFGHLISGIYRSVKKEFNVRKYTLVLHVEAEQAIAFVENLTLNNLPQNYKRLTDSQIDAATRHGDYGILERLA